MSTQRKSILDNSPQSTSEDITDQIDRLNQALAEVMKEIEVSSCSRNPSRLSLNEYFQEPVAQTEESEDPYCGNFESTIESLLHTIDRQQMMIEDLFSEGQRKRVAGGEGKRGDCGHDLGKIRKEIWLQVSMQKNEQTLKERKSFEQDLIALDELKEDYYKKRGEILLGIEKLKIKEQLLEAKEKEMRMQRLAFEKQKLTWEQERGIDSTPIPLPTKLNSHNRSVSYSYSAGKVDLPKPEEPPKNASTEIKAEIHSPSKQDQLKAYQNELRSLEAQSKTNPDLESAEQEMKIESLRNKIAALRGEIAISESSRATRLISSVMVSLQREVTRDEKPKKTEGNETLQKNLIHRKQHVPIKPRPLDIKADDYKKPGIDAPTPKGLPNSNREFDELYQRKKALLDKEKDLAQKEAFLQETWMRIPGGKELIENVNLTLSRLQSEKQQFEKERDDFYKERKDFLQSQEKNKRK